MVIAHECAEIVEESGKDVEHLVVGDCVALEPGISCHHCDECKEGSYNLCSNMRFFVTAPGNWLLAQQVHNSNCDLLFVAKMAQALLGSLLSIGILPILLHDRLAVSRNAMCTMYCRSTLEISSIYDPLVCLVFHLTLFW
jgi:hypothetical protein